MKTLVCVFLSFLITLATPTITLAACLPDYEGPCNDTVGGASKNNEDNLIAAGILLGLGIWYVSERHTAEETFSARNKDIDKKLEAPQRFIISTYSISTYSGTGRSIGSIGLEFTYKF